ncbi:MAG: hypothetical protein AAGA96_00085 [Verrucomicrobiota bacterium]
MKKKEPSGWHWIESWRSGTISREAFSEFQEALRDDAEVRETLRRSMAMDSALREVAEAKSIQEAWSHSHTASSDRSWMKAAAILVAGVLFGGLGTGAVLAFNGAQAGSWNSISLSVFDGGFESGSASEVLGYPISTGLWTGDPSEVVASGDDGIVPYEGERMLRFQKTAGLGEQGKQQRANLWQMTSLADVELGEEPVIATVRARFNRIAGDHRTDTQVRVEISAFSGMPSDLEKRLDSSEFLTRTITRVEIDAEPESWEAVQASIIVPQGTTMLLLGVAADENVHNNPPEEMEFEGHYVDAVELELSQASGLLPKKKRRLFQKQSDHDFGS